MDKTETGTLQTATITPAHRLLNAGTLQTATMDKTETGTQAT